MWIVLHCAAPPHIVTGYTTKSREAVSFLVSCVSLFMSFLPGLPGKFTSPARAPAFARPFPICRLVPGPVCIKPCLCNGEDRHINLYQGNFP